MFKSLVIAKSTEEDEHRISFDDRPERISASDMLSRLEEESKASLSNLFGSDYHNEEGSEYVDSEHGKFYLVG